LNGQYFAATLPKHLQPAPDVSGQVSSQVTADRTDVTVEASGRPLDERHGPLLHCIFADLMQGA
jgi:hypothetical protein